MTAGDYARLLLAVVGLLLPLAVRALNQLRRLQRGRRILKFNRTNSLSVVLTTSEVASPISGIPAARPLTGYGQVRGVANCTRALTRLYPKKLLSLHLSGYVRGSLGGDLVLLGGPLKNAVSSSFLRSLARQYNFSEFEFDDQNRNLRIAVPGCEPYENLGFMPDMEERANLGRFPKNDIGLIVLGWHTGEGGRAYRCVLCAGFTTYGTAAAASYLFSDLVNMSRRRASKEAGIGFFPGRQDVVVVVEADISEGELFETRPIAHFRLRRAKTTAPQRQFQPA